MIIAPLKCNNIFDRKKVIVFDTEAYRYKTKQKGIIEYQKLAIYSIFDGEKYYNGNNTDQFLNHLKLMLEKYKRIIVFAHNIKYDITNLGLLIYFISHKPLFDLKQRKLLIGDVTYVQYKGKNESIEFIDSYNFFKVKLSAIAHEMDLEKYATNEDYKQENTVWNTYLEQNGQQLCNQDCYILYRLVNEMQQENSLCWGISMAQTSFKTFCSKYLKININLSDYNDISMNAYYGGRCEVYDLNFHNFVIDLDINSLYPYIMMNNKYSYKFRQQVKNAEYIIQNIKNNTYNYLLNIDYKILNEDVPRIPILLRHDNKLMQFKEAKNVWITGREFLTLISDYTVDYKIINGYEFYNNYLFKDFVEYFYQLKSSSNGFKRLFWKGILNSLYGKFGQHKASSTYILIDNITDQAFKQFISQNSDKDRVLYNDKYYSLYGDYIVFLEKKEPKYAVLLAAEISADARLYNYEIQKKLGFDHVFYTDTDSFFTDLSPDNEIVKSLLGPEIGKMKIEKQGTLKVNAPKSYIFSNENGKTVTQKGIPANARKIGKNTYEYDSIKYIKTKEKGIIVKHIVKTVKNENNKMNFSNGIGRVWLNFEEYDNNKKLKFHNYLNLDLLNDLEK